MWPRLLCVTCLAGCTLTLPTTPPGLDGAQDTSSADVHDAPLSDADLLPDPDLSDNDLLPDADPDLLPDADLSGSDLPGPDLPSPEEVAQLLSDPLGNSPFAYVFQYAGKIYLGPNNDGNGAVRFPPDGSSSEPVTFALPADTNGDKTRNAAGSPFPSIGRTGCTPDTTECGPDNENGRGVFAAGTIANTEWLVIIGGRTDGDLNYIYMSQDVDKKIDFHYVDLSALLGGQTKGSSAAHFFNGNLYLGFPDTGSKKPYLVMLEEPPTAAPGLDVTDQAVNLNAHDMDGIGDDQVMIDAIIDFNNRIYVFNGGGCIRAMTTTPSPYTNGSSWVGCSPAANAYKNKTAHTTSKVVDIEPADKAFPQLAVFGGRLYAGRNTADGPQLWVCEPAKSEDLNHCDPGDWTPLAANTAGDSALSKFNNVNNTSISLVVATSKHLYVGFDNVADGIVVFRSNVAAPESLADFVGQSGCSADQHPAGCEGLGSNGFGKATNNTRILDGFALDSSDDVYLTTSTGKSPAAVNVYRISN